MAPLDGFAAALLMLAVALAGLVLIPFGLPGLWLIVLAIIGYGWLSDFQTTSAWFLILVIALALGGELIEAWIGFRFAQRYGGSRRAGWGALVGGLAGAIVGVPLPIVGSVIGGFVGAFIGATVFEYTRARQAQGAARAGWGAVLGRAAAVGIKMGIGVMLGVMAVVAVMRGQ
ncbi:MAG: DUF456 family protein [Gemmatimonadales bacterium]